MAALVRRASFSLTPLVIRSPGFSSSVIPASPSVGCSSSVLHLHNRLFASTFQPFSATSASIGHAESHKTGNLTLHWESSGETILIKVTEKVHVDHSKGDVEEPSLQMHIKFLYGDKLSNCLEFDVAFRDDQSQFSIHNEPISVDYNFRDVFKGLLQKRGFNKPKFDFVVKCAEKLREYKKLVESNTASVNGKFLNYKCLTLYWEANDEVIEIQVKENIDGKGYSKADAETRSLYMYINIRYGDKFCKRMRFEADLPDDQGSIAINNVTMRVDTGNRLGEHFGEFTGLLEKRGLNSSNLDFVVKYANKLNGVMNKW